MSGQVNDAIGIRRFLRQFIRIAAKSSGLRVVVNGRGNRREELHYIVITPVYSVKAPPARQSPNECCRWCVFGAFSDGKHLLRLAEIVDCGGLPREGICPKMCLQQSKPS